MILKQFGAVFIEFSVLVFEMPVFYCSICGHKTRFLHFLLRHYDDHSNLLPDMNLKCPIEHCCRTYKSVNSLRNHISLKHKSSGKPLNKDNLDSDNNNDENTVVECQSPVSIPSPLVTETVTPNENDSHEKSSSESVSDRDLKLFLLNLKVKKYVSDAACEMIVNYIEKSYQNSHTILCSILDNNESLTEEDKNKICQPFNRVICDLHSFNTSYKLTMKLKENNYIEPEEIILQSNMKTVYIPLLRSLELLLSHEDVLAHVLQSNNANFGEDEVIEDFSTGGKASQSNFFNTNNKLQIQLYFDDYTLTNPLASSSRKHKICAVYFQLGNIPHCFRSKLHTIQLVSLTNSAVVKHLGFSVVFEQLLIDLHKLETDGITITFENQIHHFKGSVSTLVADNLASHEVGGFVTSFSAFRMCRFCNATKDKIKNHFLENEYTLRTIESYTAQLEMVQQNSNLSSIYGIKCNSFLNELEHFHICWSSPSDIAHDLFEGVCIDLLSTVLGYFIKEKYFNLEFLNDVIKTFPYFGKDIRNKPEILFSKGSKIIVRQTASQSLCLTKLLPLMIGNKIPLDSTYWLCYLSFLDCLDFILSPSLYIGQIKFMTELISNFLTLYCKLDDSTNIKPKFHYMIHYGSQYKYFGPLINQSTLRYEGKHSNLKSLFGNSKNYRNPCLSIAKRHQNLQALHHHNANFLEDDHIQTNKCSSKDSQTSINLLPNEFKHLFTNMNPNQKLTILKKTVSNGISYERNAVVIMEFSYEHNFVFAQIDSVVFLKGVLYLIVEPLDCVEYCRHIHSYILEKKAEKNLKLLSIGSLLLPNVISPYNSQQGIVANLPHFIRHQ